MRFRSSIKCFSCHLITSLDQTQAKINRVDFVLVGMSPDEHAMPTLIHRFVEKPKLVNKPYLELDPNTELLLVEIPVRSSPEPEVSCFVNELPVSGFDWEFSAHEELCTVGLNDILIDFSVGDLRIVLANQIGSFSVLLTYEQIMQFKKESTAVQIATNNLHRKVNASEIMVQRSGNIALNKFNTENRSFYRS